MTTRDPFTAHVYDSPNAKEIDPVANRFARVPTIIRVVT